MLLVCVIEAIEGQWLWKLNTQCCTCLKFVARSLVNRRHDVILREQRPFYVTQYQQYFCLFLSDSYIQNKHVHSSTYHTEFSKSTKFHKKPLQILDNTRIATGNLLQKMVKNACQGASIALQRAVTINNSFFRYFYRTVQVSELYYIIHIRVLNSYSDQEILSHKLSAPI